MSSFDLLPLPQPLREHLATLGFLQMTPIQAQALPLLLNGRDVIGQAATGTGKTAAFGLALLSRQTPGSALPGALVLCPTRELAAQVAEELRRLARPLANMRVVTLCGGAIFAHQRDTLARGADVIVGTPGRVQDHLSRGTLDLSQLHSLVLDEADRMLDMGFVDEVEAIANLAPTHRQTSLFSATMSDDVHAMSARLLRDPELVVVEPPAATVEAITQRLYAIGALAREEALIRVLAHHQPASAVIFCNQRVTCDAVVDALAQAGYVALSLHGGMEQRDRDLTLLRLSQGSLRWLVATDVAARGLDIDALPAVISYDLATTPEVHTHRIGRTGRAGREGEAISLIELPRQRRLWRALEPALGELEPALASSLPEPGAPPAPAAWVTLMIQGGKRDKLRPGDIVGALTQEVGLSADQIGPISVLHQTSFVAIARDQARRALRGVNQGQIKNRRFRASLAD